MGIQKRHGKYIKLSIYLVIIVLINVAGITLFFRIDLTENKIYSIISLPYEVMPPKNNSLWTYVLPIIIIILIQKLIYLHDI